MKPLRAMKGPEGWPPVEAETPIVLGFDPAITRRADAFVALLQDGRISHLPTTDLTWHNAEVGKMVQELADLYDRPTFFNQPIGFARGDGTPVYWSDLVDENIAAADVTITL